MTKILTIDDDKNTTYLLEKVLSDTAGYDVVAENNSSKALQRARIINPDLILLDLMMPDPDGFKVCRMLRAEPGFVLTPIMIVTALDDSDSKIIAFGAGADEYLTKPFSVDELLNRVKDILRARDLGLYDE